MKRMGIAELATKVRTLIEIKVGFANFDHNQRKRYQSDGGDLAEMVETLD